MHSFRRDQDPERWSELTHADEAVVTRVDDAGGVISSASKPSLVAEMLDALRVEDGMSVLEIGTGTGFTAALLAHRLGAGKVTSVEIDPAIAAHAADRLAAAGYDVPLVVGDGECGRLPGAPYDRVIATAAVHKVPYAWVEQTRPGGLILTPWTTDYHNGALLRLIVGEDGAARGRFIGNAAFMRIHSQRLPRVAVDDAIAAHGAVGRTGLHPYAVAGEFDASFAIGLAVPDCRSIVIRDETHPGRYAVWFVTTRRVSWARVHVMPGADEYEVRQFGPRRLWDEIEAAHTAWSDLGRPAFDRYSMVVGPDGQHVGVRAAGAP